MVPRLHRRKRTRCLSSEPDITVNIVRSTNDGNGGSCSVDADPPCVGSVKEKKNCFLNSFNRKVHFSELVKSEKSVLVVRHNASAKNIKSHYIIMAFALYGRNARPRL